MNFRDLRINSIFEINSIEYTKIGYCQAVDSNGLKVIIPSEREVELVSNPPALSPKEFAEQMEKCRNDDDPENASGNCTDLMEQTLISLGYIEGIKILKTIKRY